jgi:transposase-like protein
MAARKTEAEWDRIELEYLAGDVSVREIADRYGISDTAIRKRAKAQGWVRAVRRPPAVRTSDDPTPRAPREQPEPVEASVIAERGRQLVGRMLDELDATTTHQGELEEMIEDATADDRDSKRRDAMLGAISLGGRAKTLKELATAFKTINEASVPQGKKAAAQDRAREVAGGSRFKPVGPVALHSVK